MEERESEAYNPEDTNYSKRLRDFTECFPVVLVGVNVTLRTA